MKNKAYRKELKRLHGELVAMQEWVKATGAKVVIVFEGRDTAGKGGVIQALTERVSPRVFRVVALPAPTDEQKSQMYIQRYVPHLPSGGEVVIFDRSWYNRAGVERIFGYATEDEVEGFLQVVPEFERLMARSGIILLKYWLEVSPEQQTERLQGRIDDKRKVWKLSGMDLASYEKWDEYTNARDEMLARTHSEWAPWRTVLSDDKEAARLNLISDILAAVPYTPLERERVVLPERTVTPDSAPQIVQNLLVEDRFGETAGEE
jgi:polyphosphate kinase 2